jgi:hypothetical protein
MSGHLDALADLRPGEDTFVPFECEAGRDPEPAWTLWRKEDLLPLSRIEPRLLGHPASTLVIVPTELPRIPIDESLPDKLLHKSSYHCAKEPRHDCMGGGG